MIWRLGQFLLIGAVLFAGKSWLEKSRPAPGPEPIEISALQEIGIRGQFMVRMGREPTEAELAYEISRAVDEEVLFREAIALGMQQTDSVVRQRLARNLRFVDGNTEKSDDELVREAFRLGLDRSDPIVRRRLIQRIRLAVGDRVRRESIPEAELREVYDEQAERFRAPARVSLAHVFLSRDRRSSSLKVTARVVSERLRAHPLSNREAIALGDPFLQGHEFTSLGERELANIFGPEFARAAFTLASDAWSEPLNSAYGLHIVRISAFEPEGPQRFELVRAKISAELLAKRERAALGTLLQELKKGYRIVRLKQ